MPTFYDGKPIEVVEQSVSSSEWAQAYYTAQSTVSLMHKREVKAGICLTAAILIGSIVPVYHSMFSTVFVPCCGIFVALVLCVIFYFFQPKDIRSWANQLYCSNTLLSLSEKITIYRDSVVIENDYEKMLEYWTDFSRCIEAKEAFVIVGGLERNLLTIKKQGLNKEQINKISAHFANTFASRYIRS